jgi:hypothetical protein
MSSASPFGGSLLSLQLVALARWRSRRRRQAVSPRRIDAGGAAVAGASPKLFRNREGVNLVFGPPGDLVAAPMKRAVVQAAEGNREFVAHTAAERCRLCEPHVVSIKGLAAAQQAWLQGHELKVIAVAVPARF